MATTSSISVAKSISNDVSGASQSGGGYSFGLLKNVVYATPAASSSSTTTTSLAARSYLQTYANAPANMLKSLTVHLNRGTESLKSTVQKALFSAVSSRPPPPPAEMANNPDHTSKTKSGGGGDELKTTQGSCSSISKDVKQVSGTDSIPTMAMENVDLNPVSSASAKDARPTVKTEDFVEEPKCSHQVKAEDSSEVYTLPPTEIHRRTPKPEEHQRTDSVDSLREEVLHFKPIRPMAITLKKR